MTNYIVRPNSYVSGTGPTSPAASADVLTNLSDDSDTTFVSSTGALDSSASRVFKVSTPAVPSSEFMARVGFSIRWKGSSSLYSIGGRVWRGTDAAPSNWLLTPNNSSAFTTTELGVSNVTWPNSDANKIWLRWFDGKSSQGWPTTQTADVWATVYTIAKPTVTVSNLTETTSMFPIIPVSTTATIGFEASVSDVSPLRKVTAEVRIESGGTGVGTGTLVTSGTADVTFTATGTQTIFVQMPDAVFNGTYKIYARALRYRDDGVARDDQYSAWTTAATLTMNVPPPNAPTITTFVDQTADIVSIRVTPVATTNYTAPFITVERSADSGLTWQPVRKASAVAGAFGTQTQFLDYEAPRGVGVTYRARTDATYQNYLNSSAWATASAVVVNSDTWNMKLLSAPDLNVTNLQVTSAPDESVDEDMGVFRPIGRRYPVVVSGTLSGWDGSFTVQTSSEAEWHEVRAVIESQEVILLESVFGWAKYIRLLSGTKSAQSGTPTAPRRSIALSYVEVDTPPITAGEAVVVPNFAASMDLGTAFTSVFEEAYDGGTAYLSSLYGIDGGEA